VFSPIIVLDLFWTNTAAHAGGVYVLFLESTSRNMVDIREKKKKKERKKKKKEEKKKKRKKKRKKAKKD